MQDRYAGDLGDYLKFGLLRWLVPLDSPASLRLGVVWCRTLNEVHNTDGKHTAVTCKPGHRSAARLRPLDPDLYQRLARVVTSGRRNTDALAGADVLSTAHASSATRSTSPASRPGRPGGQPGRPGGAPGCSRHWRRRRIAT